MKGLHVFMCVYIWSFVEPIKPHKSAVNMAIRGISMCLYNSGAVCQSNKIHLI